MIWILDRSPHSRTPGSFVGSGVRGRYLLAPSVRNYVRHLREVAAGRQGNELNAVDENARLKMAQRENYELKNSILRASAIPYEAIAPAWARVVRAIRSAMLAVPGKAHFRLVVGPFEIWQWNCA